MHAMDFLSEHSCRQIYVVRIPIEAGSSIFRLILARNTKPSACYSMLSATSAYIFNNGWLGICESRISSGSAAILFWSPSSVAHDCWVAVLIHLASHGGIQIVKPRYPRHSNHTAFGRLSLFLPKRFVPRTTREAVCGHFCHGSKCAMGSFSGMQNSGSDSLSIMPLARASN
jgi:hypothetical protein